MILISWIHTGYLSVKYPISGDARQYGKDKPSIISPT